MIDEDLPLKIVLTSGFLLTIKKKVCRTLPGCQHRKGTKSLRLQLFHYFVILSSLILLRSEVRIGTIEPKQKMILASFPSNLKRALNTGD